MQPMKAVCITIITLWSHLAMAATTDSELIVVYNKFVKAAETGKEVDISNYVSSRYLNTFKNNLASAGITNISEMIKGLAESNTAVKKENVIKVIENGATCGLIFDIPTTEKAGNKELVEFLILKFVKEGAHWKYDKGLSSTMFKFDAAGRKQLFSDSLIPRELALDGVVPKAPALLPVAQVPANYLIFGDGYDVSLSVNGNEAVTSNGGSSSGTISGGLKKGKNSLRLTILRNASSLATYPEVSIQYLDKDGQVADAFVLDDKLKKTGEIQAEFTIAP